MARMVKIVCRAASGLSEVRIPSTMSETMFLQVMVVSLSSSLPSVPRFLSGLLLFLPSGRRLWREWAVRGACQKNIIRAERRPLLCTGAADQNSKHHGVWNDFRYP